MLPLTQPRSHGDKLEGFLKLVRASSSAQRTLRADDRVTIDISGIGQLVNTVAQDR